MKHSGTHNDLLRSFTAIVLVMFSFNCTKTIHDRRPTGTLTPESREYFGFVLNGRHFISEERTGNVSGECTYTATYDSASTFRITSSHSLDNCTGSTIEIILDSVQLKEGNSYAFGAPGPKKNYLTCFFTNECSKPAILYATKDNSFGFVKIKKYRPDIKVIGAVFSCIVVNSAGKTLQIADGYIDRHYSE